MRHIKSERLKKLESELNDLEQWLKLGLVPKKDIEKHKEEIQNIRGKIEEEKERLQFLKESGEGEEYVTPKRPAARPGYSEMPTIPDIDVGETAGMTDTGFDADSEVAEGETSLAGEKEETEGETAAEEDDRSTSDDDDAFSDRNRWRRGGIIDPDANDW